MKQELQVIAATELEEARKAGLVWVNETENATRVAMEAGLFRVRAVDATPAGIFGTIQRARVGLYNGQLTAGLLLAAEADRQLTDAIASARLWRVMSFYQLPLVLYHLGVAVVLLNVASGWGWFGRVADEFWSVPTEVLGMGALGAVLRGLYWLYFKVQQRSFRPQFVIGHISAPFIGGLLAVLVYLLVSAGIVAVATSNQTPVGMNAAVLALSFVAGFSWEWALRELDKFFPRRGESAGTSVRQEPSEPAGDAERAKETHPGSEMPPEGDGHQKTRDSMAEGRD